MILVFAWCVEPLSKTGFLWLNNLFSYYNYYPAWEVVFVIVVASYFILFLLLIEWEQPTRGV